MRVNMQRRRKGPVASLQGMLLECYTACAEYRQARDAQKGIVGIETT